MINVEVRKCLLKVIFCEEILGLETSHNKLSQINKARVVGVNESHHKIHFACRNVRFGSQSLFELHFADHSIMINI